MTMKLQLWTSHAREYEFDLIENALSILNWDVTFNVKGVTVIALNSRISYAYVYSNISFRTTYPITKIVVVQD